MAETTPKPSLQKHGKDPKTWEERMDQLRESMARNFEKMENIGIQINQLSQKTQTTGEEVVQKILEAIESFSRSAREKSTSTEVPILSTTSLDSLQPTSPLPSSLSPLQLGTTTSMASTISTPTSAMNPVNKSCVNSQIMLNPYPTPYAQSPTALLPDSMNIPIKISVPGSVTTRPPSQTVPMVAWPPYTDPANTTGTIVHIPPPYTPTYSCSGTQNLPNNISPYCYSNQAPPIHAPNYPQINGNTQFAPTGPTYAYHSNAQSPSHLPSYNCHHSTPPLPEPPPIVFAKPFLNTYHQFSAGSTPNSHTPLINPQSDAVMRPMTMPIAVSNIPKFSSQTASMGKWTPYTDPISTVGTLIQTPPPPTSSPQVCFSQQNHPNYSNTCNHTSQYIPIHATSYDHMNYTTPLYNSSYGTQHFPSGAFYTFRGISQPSQFEDPSSTVTHVCTKSIRDKEFPVANKAFDKIPERRGYTAALNPDPPDDYGPIIQCGITELKLDPMKVTTIDGTRNYEEGKTQQLSNEKYYQRQLDETLEVIKDVPQQDDDTIVFEDGDNRGFQTEIEGHDHLLTANAVKGDEELELLAFEFPDSDDSSAPYFHFTKKALSSLVPMLRETLLEQDKVQYQDNGIWNLVMAGGTCRGLVARTVGDALVPLVMTFMAVNILKSDWRSREEVTYAFSSILEGPSIEKFFLMVNTGLEFLLNAVKDGNNHVKDTTAWTLNHIFELMHTSSTRFSMISPANLQRIVEVLLESINGAPHVSKKVCGTIYYLAQGYEDVESSQIIAQLLPAITMKPAKTAELQIGSSDDREKQGDLQETFWGDFQVIIQKLSSANEMKPIILQAADQIMMFFFMVFDCRNSTVYGKTKLAIGALAETSLFELKAPGAALGPKAILEICHYNSIFCEPVEKKILSHSFTTGLAQNDGHRNQPLSVYNMMKYAATAHGDAEMFMKFEEIRDHAVGVVIIRKASGIISNVGICGTIVKDELDLGYRTTPLVFDPGGFWKFAEFCKPWETSCVISKQESLHQNKP